jgi:hypothetical protein
MKVYDQQAAPVPMYATEEHGIAASTDTPLGTPNTFAGTLARPQAVDSGDSLNLDTEQLAWLNWVQLPDAVAATDSAEESADEQGRTEAVDQIRELLRSSELGQLLPATYYGEDETPESADFSDPRTVRGLLEALNEGVISKRHVAEFMEASREPVADQKSVPQTAGPAKIFAPGALIPRLRFNRQVEGTDFGLMIRISGQNPTTTAIQGANAAKDKSIDISEQLLEMYRARKGNPDKAAAVSITHACAQIILGHSDHNGMIAGPALETSIRREQPSLLEDELFKRVLRHFNTDPENFREGFSRHNDKALTQIVMAHPARQAFLRAHGIEAATAEDSNDQ